MSATTPRICSKRLKLDGITLEDAEFIVALRSNPDVYRYFTNPCKVTIDGHISWFKSRYVIDENRMDFIAREKDSNLSVGVFGLKLADEYIAEVSYILAPEVQGKGYASEAVLALMEWAKNGKWQIHRAIATIHKDNQESIHFIEKLGYMPVRNDGVFIVYEKYL